MIQTAFFIRPVTATEIDSLLEVYLDCADYLAPGLKPKPSREMILRDLQSSKEARGVFCGIYDDFGKLFGVVDFIPKLYRQKPDQAFLSLLMLKKSHRRQGYGAQVLESVETQITRDPQIQHIYTALPVSTAIPAHHEPGLRFLTQMGYQITDQGPDQTPVYYMRKTVKDW